MSKKQNTQKTNKQHGKTYTTHTDMAHRKAVYCAKDTKTDRQDSVNKIDSNPNSETEDNNT